VIKIKKHIAKTLIKSNDFDISKYNESFLEKSIKKGAGETDCSSIEEYSSLLEEGEQERNKLIKSLDVNHSEFFRNPLTFAVLERIVLPSLIKQKKINKYKEARIWSSACAEGQEVYSLTILFEEMKNGNNEQIKYRILATDKCEAQLNRAIKGNYTLNSLDNMSLKRINKWFNKNGSIYAVKPELMTSINFSIFDLLDTKSNSPPAGIFADFDLVICANLLFYYKPEFQKIIIDKLTHNLADGAFLVTGEAEREIVMKHNYREVFPQSAIFQVSEVKRNML
jgi:chemotaxis protein methyltransferase CheR